MKQLVVAVVVVMVMMVGRAGMVAASCDPDCSGHSLGDKVVDPRDCHNYYYCLGDGMVTDRPVVCPDNKTFDAETLDCKEGDCVPLCGGGGGCHLTCNGTGDIISDVDDCSKYYICYPGTVQEHSCGSQHPYFDGVGCGDDPKVCCLGLCEPFCDALSIIVPDPKDCKWFYFCEGEGTPPEDLRFKCPNDWTFNVQLGECTADAQCTDLCKESNPSSTTSPLRPNSTPSAGDKNATITTTSSLTTLDGNGCSASLVCPSAGNFPACTTCQPQYFSCTQQGEAGVAGRCTGDLVFNTDPDFPYCILPTNCPYSP